jgi:hypothetical protein
MRKVVVPIFVFCIFASCCTGQNIEISSQVKDSTPVMFEKYDEPSASATVIEDAPTICPKDMVNVVGDYCFNLEEICLEWLDKPLCTKTDPKTKECISQSTSMRCGEFKFPTVCKSKTKHMNFCIDRYEYPNQLGVKPKLQNTWYQAKSLCEAQGKRLCVDNEWTQACRGPDNRPYPYGYKRDATACRIDLPWQDPTTHTFEELDKTVPAGSMPACISAYGAYDMTGNGDEWCQSSGGSPYISVLKGGHPHGVRNRCSPRTDGHGPGFSFYDTGFRCCKDIK